MFIASVSISLGGSVVVFLLLAVVGIAAAVLFYRYTLPPLPIGRRIVLSVLRSVALLLLLLILFEPILRLVSTSEQPPAIALLVDNSQSMAITDATGDRAEAVRSFLDGGNLARLSSDATVQRFAFSSKLTPSGPEDSLRFNGEVTDIAQALAELKDRLARGNVQSVILVSDGNYTTGRNPIYDAEALRIPVFTVGVGDTTEQKDVLVEKIVANEIVFAETRVPVDVTIKSSGYGGEKVEVTISEGSTILDRKMLTLQASPPAVWREGTNRYPVRLTVESKEEGTKKYTVRVSTLEGELTERNNVRSFFVKVLKSKLRILLFAGAPSPDVAAVRQALAEDERLSVRSFVQKGVNDFYEGTPSRTTLDSADCFVFVEFPSAATSGSVITQIHTLLDQTKKPLLFVNGRSTDYDKLETLETFLPFGWSRESRGEIFVFPSVSDRQRSHPLVALEGGSVTAEAWSQLPPIYKTQTIFRAKSASTVLAQVRVQNVVIDEPLVLVHSIVGQKSFAVTGHGVWRWRLLAHQPAIGLAGNNAQTERFFPLLLTNAIRWLTTKEEGKNVRVVPTKETFTTAEPVEFTGQVYDEQLQPVDNAELTVELTHGAEKFQIAMNSVGNGRYEGSLEGLGESDYTFTGKAVRDGRALGDDRGRFSVGQMNVEFLETKMNKSLLEQIAYRTGGKYYDLAAAGSTPARQTAGGLAEDLTTDVRLSPKEIMHTTELELWNWRYLAAVLILVLAIEWFLRKRSGML